jgi:hypothetical protein
MPRFAASPSMSMHQHQHDPRSSIGAQGRPLSACPAHDRSNGGREAKMPKEKTLEEKLEEASSAVERALEVRDKAIQDLMKAKMAYGEVWRKLHDKKPKPGHLSES